MRRICYLTVCMVCLSMAGVAPLGVGYASASDTKPTPRRGIAVLASSIGSGYSPESLAALVQQWEFSPVVIDWAWITAHWDQTDFGAVNHFIELMAARGVPVVGMYRPRFLNNPTVPIQLDRAGRPAASHGSYICFSSSEARQWGIAWGTRILQQCPRIREIIIYNPLNECQCSACREAAQGNPYAHYDAVWKFLAEARAAWQRQRPEVKLGVVFVNDPEFWQRGRQVLDVAHPFLFITDDTDMSRDADEANAIRDLLPGKTGPCLAKITWGPNDRVSPARLAEFDKSAAEAGLAYFFWTAETLFDSSLYDQQAVADVLRANPLASNAQAAATIPAQQGSGEPGDLRYTPDQIRSISAEEFLERMLHPEPGYWQFAAMNALAEKARRSEAAGRREMLSLVIAAMMDKRRPIDQRWQCCYVLSDSRDEQGVPDLIQVLLFDESEIMRSVAAEALAISYEYARNSAAHDALLQAARQETSPRVREVLARRLGAEMPAAEPIPAPAAIPAPAPAAATASVSTSSSFEGVTNPPGGFHRGDATYTPEEIRQTSVETFLEWMLHPQEGYGQFAAMNALSQKARESDPAARERIMSFVIGAMRDRSRPVYQRWQCCYVISGCGYEKGVTDLIEILLHDQSDTMRGVAEEALKQFPESEAAREALSQAASRQQSAGAREGPSRAGGYTALEIRRTSAEVFLERMLHPEPGYGQFAAMNALAQKAKESTYVKRRAILSLVTETMRNKYKPLLQRWQCCYVLSGSGDERVVPELIEVLLHDESEVMRGVAVDALAEFPQNAAARNALLEAARQETNESVRQALTRNLGQATPEGPSPPAAVEERAREGPPRPPPAPRSPVTEPLSWPFQGDQESQVIFNNYQQATDIYIHCGLDFIQPAGTPVMAVASGYVAAIFTNYPDWITHYFFIVTPEEGGDEGWCYTHMDPRTFTFKEGDFVRQGQRLGSLVDFSVGNQPGVAHLHLHYVRFTRYGSGEVKVHSLLDPLYFFDWEDTEPPAFQPLRFVSEGTTRQFRADAAGVVTVSGRVDVLAAVTDSAYPGHMGNLGVPVVMFSISDGRHTMQKLVLDHRGDVGDETQVRPLYLPYDQKKAFFNPDSFPRYQMLTVTKTDGDGLITPQDARECWDTTARDDTGKPLWPDGEYSVNVYAWDISGNRAVVGAAVRVQNE